MKNALFFYAAASLGMLLQILVMNLAVHYGLTHELGVRISASYSPAWMYPRLVWGGLWGLIFLLPILSGSIVMRSLVLCLIPACVQLFIIYPFYEGKSVAGMSQGMLTPLVVVFFWWLWALFTSLIMRFAR